ncbi:MAG: efflux RND transporter periplasmic adaptor subunit, partial [Pseudolabrys sp.]|nr:efflux RND transporter periplasmic adaptor subunit [Pseudolabrys sp.]
MAFSGSAVLVLLLLAIFAFSRGPEQAQQTEPGRRVGALYYPTAKQWENLTVETVAQTTFRTEHSTEGKIGIDEDRATLVYSPYSGRITKLLAKPGDVVGAGQPLFVVEAPDMVQAQNDFINAVAGLNKANAQRE